MRRKPGQIGAPLFLVVEQYPLRRAVEVIVLAAPQAPQEGGEGGGSQKQGKRDKEDQAVHSAGTGYEGVAAAVTFGGLPAFRRRALATTTMEDSDMASAAINGVTWPPIAIGSATAL